MHGILWKGRVQKHPDFVFPDGEYDLSGRELESDQLLHEWTLEELGEALRAVMIVGLVRL
jgi:hypothetical protein